MVGNLINENGHLKSVVYVIREYNKTLKSSDPVQGELKEGAQERRTLRRIMKH